METIFVIWARKRKKGLENISSFAPIKYLSHWLCIPEYLLRYFIRRENYVVLKEHAGVWSHVVSMWPDKLWKYSEILKSFFGPLLLKPSYFSNNK